MKSRLIILLVFAGCLSAIAAVGVFRAIQAAELRRPAVATPADVRCTTVEVRDYELTESFYGLFEADKRVAMSFQIAGRLQSLGQVNGRPLRENDVVTPDTVLATLERDRYQAAVEQAQARESEAGAAMAQAEAQIAQAQAELADARFNLARVQRLLAEGTAKEREGELADLAVKLAEAQLKRAQAAAASASAGYDGARAAVSLAKVNLNDTELKAPMHGRIASVPVEPGQMVQPGQAAMTIVDLRKVKLMIGVVEQKLPLLIEGQRVKVIVPTLLPRDRAIDEAQALAYALDGVIVTVPPAADPQAGVFNVEIEVDNRDDRLRPGMIGRAVVALGTRRAVAIPATAATPQGNRITAFFVREGLEAGADFGGLGEARLDVPASVAQRVVLEPVAMHKDMYLVPEAPAGMTRLVIEGQSRLTNGQPVRVIGPTTAGVTVDYSN